MTRPQEWRGETLGVAIPRLGAAYGEHLRCGPNAAARRYVLLPGDTSLPAIKARLSGLVGRAPGKAFWYSDGSGPGYFTFDEDRASVEARLKAGGVEAKRLEKLRRQNLAAMVAWTRGEREPATPEERNRRTIGRWVRLFQALPRTMTDRALAGHAVDIPREQLSATAASQAEYFLAMRPEPELTITLRPSGTPTAPGLQLVVSPRPRGGGALQEVLLQPRWTREDGSDYSPHHEGYRERRRGPIGMERIAELQRRVSLTGESDALLAALHDQTGVPVVGEYDPCYGNPFVGPTSGRKGVGTDEIANLPAWQALEMACRHLDLEWSFEGGWVVVRSPRSALNWAGLVDLSPPRPQR